MLALLFASKLPPRMTQACDNLPHQLLQAVPAQTRKRKADSAAAAPKEASAKKAKKARAVWHGEGCFPRVFVLCLVVLGV